MSDDPIVKFNWAKIAPVLKLYMATMFGIFLGLVLIKAANEEPLFQSWADIGVAFVGGALIDVVMNWNGGVPKNKAARQKRVGRHIMIGAAYGMGAVNLVDVFERISKVLLP